MTVRLFSGTLAALLLLAATHAFAQRLSVNPYGIPFTGGGCTNTYWRGGTGCGTVPGDPGTTPPPGVPMCENIAPAGHTPIIAMQSTDPIAPCYQPGPVPPLCPDAAPTGYQNILAPTDPLCLDVCSDELPSLGHLGGVIATQTVDPAAPCYRGAMCASDAPTGYPGTIIPDQDIDPLADCYVGDMCADEAPPGYSGMIVPVQTTDAQADCFRCPEGQILLDDGTCIELDNSDSLAPCAGHIHPYTVIFTGAGPLHGTSITGSSHGPASRHTGLDHAHSLTGTYTDPDDGHSYSFVRVFHAPATLDPDGRSCLCPDDEVLRPDGGCGPLPAGACVGGMVSWDDDAAYATLPGFPAVSSAPSPTLLCEGFVPVTDDASVSLLTNTRVLRAGDAALLCNSGSWERLSSQCWATGCPGGSNPVVWSGELDPDGTVPECIADADASLPDAVNGLSASFDDTVGPLTGTVTFSCTPSPDSLLVSTWEEDSSQCVNAPVCPAGRVFWNNAIGHGDLPGLTPVPRVLPSLAPGG